MKILVTGGAGFIGSHVADAYVEAGHEVLVVDNLSGGDPRNVHPRARFFKLDITDPAFEELVLLERPEVINHHAAQISVPFSVEDPHEDARVNVLGTLRLLQAAVRAGVRKVIFASTGGAIYGDVEAPVPEEHPPNPQSPYALSKLTGEMYIRWFGETHGLAFTILRYANVYGPRQVPHGEAGVVAIFLEALLAGKVPTIYAYPDTPDGMFRDYVFVEDVVNANLLALSGGDGETLNIATGRTVSTGELYRTLVTVLREEGISLPEGADSPPRGPARPGDLKRSVLLPARARKVLRWEPRTSLREGLRRTLSHVQVHHRSGTG